MRCWGISCYWMLQDIRMVIRRVSDSNTPTRIPDILRHKVDKHDKWGKHDKQPSDLSLRSPYTAVCITKTSTKAPVVWVVPQQQ